MPKVIMGKGHICMAIGSMLVFLFGVSDRAKIIKMVVVIILSH